MTRVPRYCSIDGCDREGYAKELCRLHYQKQWKSSKTCEVDGCENAHEAKGLCSKHWQRQWKSPNSCSVPECTKGYVAKGYCAMHYQRMKVTGTTDSSKMSLEQRKESQREADRRYRERNQDKVVERRANYYAKNRDKYLEYNRQWHRANLDKVSAKRHRRRARQRGVEADNHTIQDVLDLYGTDCHICLEPINLDAPRGPGTGPGWERGLQEDHVIPLSKGGTHTLDNCRPSHGLCNLKKGNRF